MAALRIVHAPGAVPPHGHYSQAIVHGDTVYVSGLLGNSADAHRVSGRTIEDQAEHCLAQMQAILAAAGSDLACVLKLGIFIADIRLWPRVNAVCAKRFADHRPARLVVPCGPMRLDSTIEMDAIAAVRR